MSNTVFNPEAIAGFGRYFGAEAYTSVRPIGRFVFVEGMSSDGFGESPSLLAPLGEFLTGEPRDLLLRGFIEIERKMCQLGDTIIAAGVAYGAVEDHAGSLSSQINRDTSTFPTPPGTRNGDGLAAEFAPGKSQFKLAEVSLPVPARPQADFTDEIKRGSLAGEALRFLDWIWSEFNVADGQDFTSTIIAPLTGNPASIKANGEAWRTSAKGMGDIAGTMGSNLSVLLTNDWQGPAANALRDFATKYWQQGATYVAEEVGDFIGNGFDKVAEFCTAMAKLALRAITTIIDLAIKQAARCIPILGWAFTAIESAASFIGWIFGIDIANLVSDINEIIRLGKQVLTLFDRVKEVVESIKNYMNQAKQLYDFVTNIPELSEISVTEVTDALKGLKEKKEAVDSALNKSREALKETGKMVKELGEE